MSADVEVRFGMAKVKKYAVSDSGDTFEMVERPHGGLSFVLVDGQRSGKSAKSISNLVSRKAIQLLGEGVRDGAAARAAHDYLFTFRGGKVSATLNIVSVDTEFKTFVVSRNNEAPVVVYTPAQGIFLLNTPTKQLGTSRRAKPDITELPIEAGTVIVAFTDGLRHAGTLNASDPYPYLQVIEALIEQGEQNPQAIADQLVQGAVAQDRGKPKDDISVFVIVTVPCANDNDIRRLSGVMPL